MKLRTLATILLTVICITLSAQWKPIKALEGGPVETIIASGQYMVVSSAFPYTFFVSVDSGANWRLTSSPARPEIIFGNNLIGVDKERNIVAYPNLADQGFVISSYFKSNNLIPVGIKQNKGKFWVNANGKTYVSIDTCVTWQQVADMGQTSKIVGTGDTIFAFHYADMHRSFNNGTTWDSIPLGLGLELAAAKGNLVIYQDNANLKYSTNYGNTFSTINSIYFNGYYAALEFGDSCLYVGTKAYSGTLYKFDLYTGTRSKISSPVFIDSNATALKFVNGNLWIGSAADGLYTYNESTSVVSKPTNDVYRVTVSAINMEGQDIVVKNSWAAFTGGGQWKRYMHSANGGGTFNEIQRNMVSSAYSDFVNDVLYYTTYDQGVNLYKLPIGQSAQLLHTFSNTIFSYGVFHTDTTLFFISRTNSDNGYPSTLFKSYNWGVTWDSVAVLNSNNFDCYYNVVGDSVFITALSVMRVFDKYGQFAYQRQLNFAPKYIGIDDSTIVIANNTTINAINRYTQQQATIGTAVALGGSTIVSIGITAGNILASVDSQGVFIKQKGSNEWAWFGHGLLGLDVREYLFTDSLVYGVAQENYTLWCRELGNVQFNSISGKVYTDVNGNNLLDVQDLPYKYGMVSGSCGALATTNVNGNYYLLTQCDTNQVSFTSSSPYIHQVVPAVHTVVGSGSGKDFLLKLIPNKNDLEIYMWPSSSVMPGRLGNWHVSVVNAGTTTQLPYVDFDFPSTLSWHNIYSTGTAITTVANTSTGKRIYLDSLLPFGQIDIDILLRGDTTLQEGTAITVAGTVYPIVNDLSPANNSSIYNGNVVASYDPNQKYVSSNTYHTQASSEGQRLLYTIEFENVGSGPTHFVRVIDTLSELLDLQSIQIVSSSHPFEWSISGNMLTFLFDPCVLTVDSSDRALSQGYIAFSIKPLDNLVVGQTVENTAAIYFDYNTPIITNTVQTTITEPVGIKQVQTLSFNLYPNPANSQVTVTTSQANNTIYMYTAQGQLLSTQAMQGTAATLNIEALPSGIYYIEVSGTKGTARKKLVKL